MHVINTLAPVFAVIALGAILRRTGFFSADFVTGLNRLTYWFAIPCLLFYKIAATTYNFQIAGRIFIVVITGMAIALITAYVLAFFMKLKSHSVGAFAQGAYRGNLVYIGLPVIIYSFANSAESNSAGMETIAILVLSLIVPIYNIAAVVILLAGQHKINRRLPARVIRQIITNPLLLACVAGLLYSLIFPKLPITLERTFSTVGQIALPMALLCIGATLIESKIKDSCLAAFTSSIIKIALCPLAGFFVANLMGLGTGETRIALIMLACPTAITSYVMADQMGGDGDLAAAIVVVSSILSIISFSVVVAFF